METEDVDPGETYGAAVWAKVVIADLTTREVIERQESGKVPEGARAARGKRKKPTLRKKKAIKKKTQPVESGEDENVDGRPAADTREVRVHKKVVSFVWVTASRMVDLN